MMTETITYTWKEFDKDLEEAATFLRMASPPLKGIYGVPKGGLVVAVCLSNILNIPMYMNYDEIKDNSHILVVDDISDTGKTLLKLPQIKYHPTYAVFNRGGTNFVTNFMSKYIPGKEWIIFPWEGNKEHKRDGTKIG